ncbi:MAG TPA: hypothetical protein VKT12_00250, partial [Candidatus Binataceae bacterium]|nr:hypothetical protein [Candidatus Binataceae bacterium]
RDSRGGFARAGGIEQVLRLDRELDERVEARIGGKVDNGLCLFLAQHQGGGVGLLQALEAMPENQPLAEVQCGLDIGKTHRFEKKFLTSAGEKFPLRKDSRPGGIVWLHDYAYSQSCAMENPCNAAAFWRKRVKKGQRIGMLVNPFATASIGKSALLQPTQLTLRS